MGWVASGLLWGPAWATPLQHILHAPQCLTSAHGGQSLGDCVVAINLSRPGTCTLQGLSHHHGRDAGDIASTFDLLCSATSVWCLAQQLIHRTCCAPLQTCGVWHNS